MASTFTTAFIINGILSNSFTSSVKTAKMQLDGINKTVKRLQSSQEKLNTRFTNGGMSVEQYDRSILRLKQNLVKAQQEQRKLTNLITNKASSDMQYNSAKQGLISSALAVGTFMQPFIGAAKTAINFEAAMSKVGAISRATGSELAELTKTARTLGEKTQFTASQAAEAMSYLGMAGWNTQQIMAGMPGLLNLAAAGGTDLARTADIVSDNLTAFGLEAAKSGHMADVYATVITRTNTNVEMLGDTMKYAAPVAYAFGASMEETAALAGLMANSGIKASQAGTALRAGFLRLAGPPKMASKAMAQLGMSIQDITAEQKEATIAMTSLGISLKDSNGPKKMSAILTELRDKTEKLGQEEKLAALKAIFGQEAATGWLAVLNSGSGVFEKLVLDLEKSNGAADKMAKQMNANAKGAIIRLNSAVESLQISLAATFLPTLASVGDNLAVTVGALSAWSTKYPEATNAVLSTIIALSTMWISLRTGIFLFSVGKKAIADYKLAIMVLSKCHEFLATKTIASSMANKVLMGTMAAVNGSLSLLRGGLMLTNTVFTVLRAGAMKLWLALIANPLVALTAAIVGAGWLIYNNWDTIKQWFTTLWDNPTLAMQQFYDAVKNLLGGAADWVWEKWESIKNMLSTPIFGKVNIAAAGSISKIAQNAYGGIYSRGAFLTSFAERDDESAIPHTPNRRNIGLLAATNAIMGNPLGGSNITATFAPQITIQGGGSDTAAQINSLMHQKMREFEEMLKRVVAQQRRLSYA